MARLTQLAPLTSFSGQIQLFLGGELQSLVVRLLVLICFFSIVSFLFWRSGNKILRGIVYLTAVLCLLLGFAFLTSGKGSGQPAGVFFSVAGLLLFMLPAARKKKQIRLQLMIRLVKSQEVEELVKIGRHTFIEAFAAQNSEEDLLLYVDSTFTTEQMSQQIKNPFSEHYFAVFEDRIIGFLKINTGSAQTEKQDDEALEVERIYVLKNFIGQGIGQSLLDKAFQRAREKDCKSIWLGVWNKNERAIRFYQKNGYKVVGEHVFLLGTDEQTDLIMRREL